MEVLRSHSISWFCSFHLPMNNESGGRRENMREKSHLRIICEPYMRDNLVRDFTEKMVNYSTGNTDRLYSSGVNITFVYVYMDLWLLLYIYMLILHFLTLWAIFFSARINIIYARWRCMRRGNIISLWFMQHTAQSRPALPALMQKTASRAKKRRRSLFAHANHFFLLHSPWALTINYYAYDIFISSCYLSNNLVLFPSPLSQAETK